MQTFPVWFLKELFNIHVDYKLLRFPIGGM